MPFVVALFGLMKGLAWPGFAAFFAVYFHASISTALQALTGRVIKIGPSGMELSPPDPHIQKDAPEETVAAVSELRPLLIEPPKRPALTVIESDLRAAIAAMEDKTAVTDTLIRALAEARLERGHERVYRLIFGSQISALSTLAQHKTATDAEARTFFQTATEPWREAYKNYGFDGWVGFLSNNQLVRRTGNSFEITPFGEDFVTYFIHNRLQNKSL